MPAVFRLEGFRFHFFSNEGDPREPIHIHIAKAGADAKFWLYPEIQLAYNRGFDARCAGRRRSLFDRRRYIRFCGDHDRNP